MNFKLYHIQGAFLLLLIFLVNSCYQMQITNWEQGTFWHITDVHVDQNYSKTGDPLFMCHGHKKGKRDIGKYGNFLCDSPQSLVNITIEAMKKLAPNPDFIIWTGDNSPHVFPYPLWDVVFQAIENITNLLRKSFPGINIYPAIGNHDTYPPNLLSPVYGEKLYNYYLENGGWKNILPEETYETFRLGGFYSYEVKPGLWIISLNTILWYSANSITANSTDPVGQFEWFESEMKNISDAGGKVYIIGHVSPGFYNTALEGMKAEPLYHPHCMQRYFDIIKKYAEIISGQMFGHLHNDMFQLHYCDTGEAVNSALLAPSVTPWHSRSPQYVKISWPVNPSVRLVYYDKSSSMLMNYKQYYLNLTEANSKASSEKPEFQLLYDFQEAYEIPNITTKSLVLLYERLKSSPRLFNLFHKYLTAGEESVVCEDHCKRAQLCSISSTTEDEYALCMQTVADISITSIVSNNNDEENQYPASLHYFLIAACILVSIICIAAAIFYRKKIMFWKKRNYRHFSDF